MLYNLILSLVFYILQFDTEAPCLDLVKYLQKCSGFYVSKNVHSSDWIEFSLKCRSKIVILLKMESALYFWLEIFDVSAG